jgi:hypothetical protein
MFEKPWDVHGHIYITIPVVLPPMRYHGTH